MMQKDVTNCRLPIAEVKSAAQRWGGCPYQIVFLFFLLLFAFAAPVQAQVRIEYTVTISDPLSHLYNVDLDVSGVRAATLDVAMPAWTPGVYLIRDYARNVQGFTARSTRDRVLNWEQRDKQTWRIAKQPDEDVRVRYQVYSAELNDAMADMATPASTFMYVVGEKARPATVEYNVPSRWDVYTTLEKRGSRYYASDYDALADAPVLMGNFKVIDFESTSGIPHHVVVSDPDVSMIEQQITSDLTDLIDAAIDSFGPPPYQEYTFFIKVQTTPGSGSLAHLHSGRVVVGIDDFVNQTSYRRFLTTATRNLVQVWNGKRIHPASLDALDYSQEVYTRLLWMTEGVSAYLADLLSLHAGLDTPPEYYAALSVTINALQHLPGRRAMSLEEASMNTWVRSDNAVNNTVSYLSKGQLVGLFIDLEIRARTKNESNLFDVIRYLAVNYADKGLGVPEDGFLKAVEAVAGSDFGEFFDANVRGRGELNYNRHLNLAGLGVDMGRQPSSIYIGVEVDRSENNQVRIRRVIPNTPAERAKLDIGDVLVALGGDRLTFDNFTNRIHELRTDRDAELTVLRGERLISLDLRPVVFQDENWSVFQVPNPTPQQLELRNAWLGMN